jgi:glucose/arabinose dehydrogenase
VRKLLAVLAVVAAVVVIAAVRHSDGGHAAKQSAPGQATAPTNPAPSAPPRLVLAPVATVQAPTAAAVRPGERSLYITEQQGSVRRIRIEGDEASPAYRLDQDPVLDISSDVTAGGEQGLLGIAFSPKADRVFVAFTNRNADQQLDSFAIDSAGRVDTGSRKRLLVVPDFASNHNGGDLVFGPDGYLYWSMGDGGGAGDPRSNGQKTTDLLGDLLRLDPVGAQGNQPYAIPPDNPFADGNGGAPEVYAYGLRNPWRFSFDRDTDDLWIADVGQGDWEEIDFAAAADGSGKGANFGWSNLEGTHSFNGRPPPAGAVPPIYEYDHSGGRCSVTGGFVYRGDLVPSLVGTYLFGDYCQGELMGLRRTGASIDVSDLGLQVPGLSTFAEDPDGEIYVLSLTGSVQRLTLADGTGGATPSPAASGGAGATATTAASSSDAAPQLPDDPTTVADALVAAERTVRDPALPAISRLTAARIQQVAYRKLGRHPEWDPIVEAHLPDDLRAAVHANVDARRQLAAIPGPPLKDTVPAWRIVSPAAEDTLLAAYHDTEAESGVGWQYLAAINLVESGLGRIVGLSTAGARGPMQFLPSTFARYGAGGDIDDFRDAIRAAGRLLSANGFRADPKAALFRYNNSDHYVRAVEDIASVLAADPAAFAGYYRWDVYYGTSAGTALLPVGYETATPIPAAEYFAAHPERLSR